jgi:1A family penicillin-binding protein
MTFTGWYAAYWTVRFAVIAAAELQFAGESTDLAPRPQSTVVMDRNGKPAFAFFTERRMNVTLDQISPRMIDAIVAVEDRRFYVHHGLDPVRIAGAAVRNLRTGRIVQGGSTITQQVARAGRLSLERTYRRKLREAMIAVQLEQRYTKDRILREYLNTVYFGEGLYGVEAAARGYFAKSAAELSIAEAALLVALVPAPAVYSPCASVERATRRRDLVLRVVHRRGLISDAELSAALETKVPVVEHPNGSDGASGSGGEYFREEVRKRLVTMFGADRVLRGGLRVYTTYDPAMQNAAETAIRTRIAEIVKARKRAKDLQGSLVAMDPVSGDVLALVGGRDFEESRFNRATQAHRQAGSAFKPIIYAAALERGYAPGSMLRDLDAPQSADTSTWVPTGEHEASEYTLRRALNVSSNRAAAQLLQHVGVSTAMYYARRLGIESSLPAVPSLALGTGEVTLLELTAAYGVFANHGLFTAPRFITRVEDADGTTIWSENPQTTRAIGPTSAFLMSSMLADVMTSGTAVGARAAGFRLPAGGKTGTTDDYADAWFVGYTPRLVAGVWFGLDTPAPIMERGFASTVAVPAWGRFMKVATAGHKPVWYDVPSDIEKIAICRRSGARATEGCWHEEAPVQETPFAPPISRGWFVRPVEQIASTPPEPPVFEDFFPIGSISEELCPLHRSEAEPITIVRVPRGDGSTQILLKGRGGN